MKLTRIHARTCLILAATALVSTGAMAQSRQPAKSKVDPNAGAQAAAAGAAQTDGAAAAGGAVVAPSPPRPGKTLVGAPNPVEREMAPAPGTGMRQAREANPGERMQVPAPGTGENAARPERRRP